MSRLGARTFGKHEDMIFLGRDIHEQRDYSDQTADEIDKEIISLLAEAKKRAHDIITSHRAQMDALVAVLMEKETIEQEEIAKVLGKKEA